MQTEILLFFLSLSNPVLDVIGSFITVFGEQTILIILLSVVLYTYDKNKGFAICGSVVISLLSMGVLKAVIRAPRPFSVLTEIEGKRLATATGYSFPSGHTTGAAALYSSFALAIKKRKVSITCAIIIVLVGLSRLYLGVHWPLDVAAGLILGIVLSLIFYPIFEKVASNLDNKFKFSIIVGIVGSLSALIMGTLLHLNVIDKTAFSDLMKLAAFSGGGFLGIAYEVKKINFKVEGSRKQKILRIVIVITGMLIMQVGVSAIIPESIYFLGAFGRYMVTGLWLTAVFPKVFSKLFNE